MVEGDSTRISPMAQTHFSGKINCTKDTNLSLGMEKPVQKINLVCLSKFAPEMIARAFEYFAISRSLYSRLRD